MRIPSTPRTFSTRRTFTALAAFALCAASPAIVTAVASPAAAQAATAQAATAQAGTASPGTNGACKGTKGVTEVVDFTKLGGKIQVACDPTDPKGTNGLQALKGAGFTYSFVPKIPGFICRIDALPKPCNGAPAKAYWSYWHAKAGKWKFSQVGAGSYHPKPGSVEGWAFGAGKAPGMSPP
jgi:hypothetical protein